MFVGRSCVIQNAGAIRCKRLYTDLFKYRSIKFDFKGNPKQLIDGPLCFNMEVTDMIRITLISAEYNIITKRILMLGIIVVVFKEMI